MKFALDSSLHKFSVNLAEFLDLEIIRFSIRLKIKLKKLHQTLDVLVVDLRLTF